ncbi:pyrroline-5-carboxylate reductase [Aeromicrobium camelliae]|uniref:Pyrroline-5-carboxylate reductase n=1 Tax=Aeromicrobium camelliae TaxID=1538144 RepID=A0A3N6XWM5_9ACTN|nr:pyrroline-5-carboxylate reductase [Aeromicrobium camelliae]RQN02104.1 pyrroline-5-carboxylate reductase [Aeromicrobium camelliae]
MSTLTSGLRVAVIGGGVMGETLIAALRSAGVEYVTVSEPRAERAAELTERHGIESADSPQAVAGANVVILAVKPHHIADAVQQIADDVRSDAVVVSVAAGITTASIESGLHDGVAVVRAMPNTPAVIGQGMFGVSPGSSVSAEQLGLVVELLSTAGKVVVVDESQQDAVTAVSGSGPAYLFYLAEAMIDGGVAAGLDAQTARELTQQTLVGAAALLAGSEESPEELRRQVTSPNGTTYAATTTFDEKGAGAALRAGVAAAAARARELAG